MKKKTGIIIVLYVILLLALFVVGYKFQLLYPKEKSVMLVVVSLLKLIEFNRKKEIHLILWIPIILLSGIVFSLGFSADMPNLIYSGIFIIIGGILFFPETEEKD